MESRNTDQRMEDWSRKIEEQKKKNEKEYWHRNFVCAMTAFGCTWGFIIGLVVVWIISKI